MHEMIVELETPGTTCLTLFDKCVGPLTSPTNHVTLKMQETTVFSPYPRRIKHLTICRYNYKGSTFSSVIFYFMIKATKFHQLIIPMLSFLDIDMQKAPADADISFFYSTT